MKKLMGLIVSLILLLGGLAGCGNKAPVASNTATPGASTEAATSIPQASANASEKTAWPRTITDAAGKTVVLEKEPKRIAILHSLYLEYFFALEIPPVASAGSTIGNAMKAMEEWETLKPYAGTAEITDLGSARELNLEAILEAQPDVIVTFATHGNLDQIYDQLVQIAPVVLVDYNASWQEQTLACAEIVGKEAFAKEFIADTEAKIASAKEELSKYSDKTIALFRASGKSFATRGTKAYYDTFGISRPEGYPDDFATLTLEAVAEMNPDYLVFQDFAETSQAFVKEMESLSVWQGLNAVKNDRVFYFDDSLNTFGPLAMRLTAEKLTQVFQEQP